MTVALDANVLVYAHRSDSTRHGAATRKLEALAAGAARIALPWTVLYQFLRVVTHPRVFHSPSTPDVAWRFCEDLFAFPDVVVLSETERHAAVLEGLLADVAPVGNLVHDAHIAAVLLEHDVHDLVTTDADFRRFPGIRVHGLD